MRDINTYIIEKLHLKKGIKHSSDEIVRFMIIYSSFTGKGKPEYRMFGDYDSALNFVKNTAFFWDGYCLTEDEFSEILDNVIYKDFDNEVMYKNWTERLLNYTKENNIMRLFNYEEHK